MSRCGGHFRFGNTLWLSPCRRLLSRCIRVCGRLRLAELGTLRRQLRFPLLAGVCQGCSRSPSLLRYLYTKVCELVKKKYTKGYKQGKKYRPAGRAVSAGGHGARRYRHQAGKRNHRHDRIRKSAQRHSIVYKNNVYILFTFLNTFVYNADMKTFRELFEERGLTPAKAAKVTGMPSVTIASHYYGVRKISPDSAIKYEKLLGIPRWETRPDLWNKPE